MEPKGVSPHPLAWWPSHDEVDIPSAGDADLRALLGDKGTHLKRAIRQFDVPYPSEGFVPDKEFQDWAKP